jgi:hypothetical protein
MVFENLNSSLSKLKISQQKQFARKASSVRWDESKFTASIENYFELDQ